ncbi:MAG: hypothetical protein OES38_08415 [Gammaproteobacteria bacterium]|nr:hypothetical protein [Gammaproteobacteria bacterium]
MPYTITVDPLGHRVSFIATGTYSQAEAFQSIQDMVGHPDFRAGYDVLVDMTGVEDVPLWGEDIREKVDFDKGLLAVLGTGTWAFVAPTDLVYGLARMYQALMDDTPVHLEIFRDLRTAQAWLDDR